MNDYNDEEYQDVDLEKIEIYGVPPHYDEPYPECQENDPNTNCCCVSFGCLPFFIILGIFFVIF